MGSLRALTLLLLSFLFVTSCQKGNKAPSYNYDNFNGYISNYTSAPLSACNSEVFVQLAFEPNVIGLGNLADVFTITPSVNSKPIYNQQKKRVYFPNVTLRHGQTYVATLKLNQLATVPSELSTFKFEVEPKTQVWNFQADYPEIQSMQSVQYKGSVSYDDCQPDKKVIENGFSAVQSGTPLNVTWTHEPKKNKSRFSINNIKRTDKQETITIKLDMNSIGVDESAEHELIIPSKADFNFLRHKIKDNDHIALYFSDPLDANQNLNGLVKVEGRKIKRMSVFNNRLDVYFANKKYGHYNVEILPGIKNYPGFPFKDALTQPVFFAPPKPFVHFAEKGNILPPENDWKVPVKSVSISGFRLQMLKVYERNVHQYFQQNRRALTEQSQLEKVGRIVLDTIFDLDNINLFNESIQMIDLGAQVNREPKALYKLFLTIPSEHNAYPCKEQRTSNESNQVDRINFDIKGSHVYYYDHYGSSFSDYASEQHGHGDPCSNYYFREIKDQRLLMCTDVGLLVKHEPEKNRYFSYVSSILSSDPISNAKVTLFDYQGNNIVSARTNGNGFANLSTKDIPFLAVAEDQSGQAVYMHLMEEKALSLSTFQVEGKDWGSKPKLFFYGDRDVWRPGDTTYVHCIYFDEKNKLPNRFPLKVELKDPRGRSIKEWTVTNHKMGLFDLRFETGINDPTGLWNLNVTIGNETYRHPVRIETIRPNRLKFTMDFERERILLHNDPKEADLSVKWMHGLDAGNLQSEISMQQASLRNPFGSYYENYVFDDIFKKYNRDLGIVVNEPTGQNGKIDFTIPTLEAKSYPSQMRFNFRLRTFEKGGAFSSDVKSIVYSPYASYVGVKWPSNHQGNRFTIQSGKNIQLIRLDENGKKASGDVEVSIQDVHHNWWYQYGRNQLHYSAIRDHYRQAPQTKTVKVGPTGHQFTLTGSGYKHVIITDKTSGHTVSRTVYVHDPNYYNASNDEMEQVEVLPFSIDKTNYKVGEIIQFQLPPASKGRYLITVENGGSIMHEEIHQASSGPVDINISVDKSMAPNAYVHVHYIAAYKQHKSHRPLRLFGLQAIKVYSPETQLNPIVKVNKEIRADESFNIKVSEEKGRRMAYTVAVVDEGLLDITQFRTPDAWRHFFAKEALNVKTWDMYRDIFHRFMGEYTSLLAVGGDGSKAISPQSKARRFKPAVKFLGPFMLEPGEVASHTELIKEYVGSVRTMVIATNGSAFGKAETTSSIIKPLMTYATLPRVLGPGERVKLPVTVFAMKDHVKNVKIDVKCLNADVFKNGSEQSITFDKIGEKDIAFWIDTPEKVDVLHFEVTATSGSEISKEKMEIDLRPSSAALTTTKSILTEGGKTSTLDFEPIGMEGTNTASVSLSRGLNFSFGPFVDRLARYPHGCLEQSVSAVFPQIFINKMGLLDNTQKLAFSQRYKAVLQKLKFLQMQNGGFAYWPGSNRPNSWGSTYALNFLVEAKEHGYDVPAGMLKDIVKYQYKTADQWVIPSRSSNRSLGRHGLDQAYRLYTLVLAGKPNFGAMNRLRLVPNLDVTSRWLLAHAMELVGEEQTASRLQKDLTTNIEDYRELGFTFGSNIRDQALILRVVLAKGDKLLAKRLIDEMTPYFTGEDNKYLSTQEIANCLISFAKFVESLEDLEKPVPVQVERAMKILFDAALKEAPVNIALPYDTQPNELSIVNKGTTDVYSTVMMTGIPIRDESDADANDLGMTVTYTNDNGQKVDFSNLQQGKDYNVTVSLMHPGKRMDYENMALSLILPPGCEIINTRMMKDLNFNEGSTSDYKDIRDDRVYTYFDLKKGETKNFRFLINATYEGKYWVPGVFAEAMYDGKIRAKTKGFWTEVKGE